MINGDHRSFKDSELFSFRRHEGSLSHVLRDSRSSWSMPKRKVFPAGHDRSPNTNSAKLFESSVGSSFWQGESDFFPHLPREMVGNGIENRLEYEVEDRLSKFKWAKKLPRTLVFGNSSGGVIDCSVNDREQISVITWIHEDGRRVHEVSI